MSIPTWRHAGRGMRITVLFFLMALLPFPAMGTVLALSYGQATRADARAEQALQTTTRIVELSRLSLALRDEKNWAIASEVIASLGVDPAVVQRAVAVEPVAALADARRRVGRLLDGVGDAQVRGAVVRAREASGQAAALAAYESAIAGVDRMLTAVQDDQADDGVAAPKLRDLDGALAIGQTLNRVMETYLAVGFTLRDAPEVESRRLVDALATHDREAGRLARRAVGDPELQRRVEAVEQAPEVRSLLDRAQATSTEALVRGVADRSEAFDLNSLMANIDLLTETFQVTRILGTDGTRLVDLTAQRVQDVAAATRAAARDRFALTRAAGLATAAAALASLWFGSRFIVDPLRRLAAVVRGLRDSLTVDADRPTGPREVREVFALLSDAAGNFDLLESQAHALATGALDAPVLDVAAPGGLGAALQRSVGRLRDALAQQEVFRRRLAHEASHDGLTQLPNRSASLAQLTQSLARTERAQSQLAVLFVDLDHFKEVNDQLGHHVGDVVLGVAARRIVAAVREGDHVGRLGGDEFVVVAEPVGDVADAVALAERVIAELAVPIEVGDRLVSIGASVGVAVADGTQLTADEILRDADLAVYRAKGTGRGGVEVCDEGLRAAFEEANDMTAALRRAIDEDELVMHYQPIVGSAEGRTVAYESLVRWARPGHEGLVPPDVFIGHAERSGLIVDLDRWVVRTVIAQLARWRDEGGDAVPVAVNISGRHLGEPAFVSDVLSPLLAHDVDPQLLIVEVTESALLEDIVGAATRLQALRDVGVRIAIDDFGTGFTSLTQLRTLPVDILKIDRSYTCRAATDAREAAIVKLIIDTGHLLGATVTAEGVETAGDAALLTDLGSDTLQGFLFARPRPPHELGRPAPVGMSGVEAG